MLFKCCLLYMFCHYITENCFSVVARIHKCTAQLNLHLLTLAKSYDVLLLLLLLLTV